MVNEHLPDLLEIEYSFKEGGHNSLKFIDGRFFFFSEADSHLTEKNEYLTMVTVPETNALEGFWEDLDNLGIWSWENNFRKNEEDTSHEEYEHDKCEHDEHENCNHEHNEGEKTAKETLGEGDVLNEEVSLNIGDFLNEGESHSEGETLIEDEIPVEGDIWQVKIINGQKRVYIKSWLLEGETGDKFFESLQKMFGINITLPFNVLSGKLSL